MMRLFLPCRMLVAAFIAILLVVGVLPTGSADRVAAAESGSPFLAMDCPLTIERPSYFYVQLTLTFDPAVHRDSNYVLVSSSASDKWWGFLSGLTSEDGNFHWFVGQNDSATGRFTGEVAPFVDTTVVLTVTYDRWTISCSVLVPGVPPTATPTVAPFAIQSITCTPKGYMPNEFYAFDIDLTLAAPLDHDYSVELTTNHPEMAEWFPDNAPETWVTFLAGQTELEEEAIATITVAPKVTDTTMIIYAQDTDSGISCTFPISGTHMTSTPTITGAPPTRTPVLTVTQVPKPQLASIKTQVSSRSGHLGRITVCLNHHARNEHLLVTLVSSRPDLISVPRSVDFWPSEKCLLITPAVAMFDGSATVTFTASLDGKSLVAVTLVRPFRPTIRLQTVSRAGGTSRMKLCDAMSGTVSLESSRPDLVQVPAHVTIPAHKACTYLVVTIGDTAIPVNVTLSARFLDEYPVTTASGQTLVRRIGVGSASIATATMGPATETPTATPIPAGTTDPTPPEMDIPAASPIGQ